jgi:hypothetical protein
MQTTLLIPTYALTGSQLANSAAVKALWICQLGGKCSEANCGEMYIPKRVSGVKALANELPYGHMSNLDAHYSGTDRDTHKKGRLGQLKMPDTHDYLRQKIYLETFITKLCPCELKCHTCHARIHGKESGELYLYIFIYVFLFI